MFNSVDMIGGSRISGYVVQSFGQTRDGRFKGFAQLETQLQIESRLRLSVK